MRNNFARTFLDCARTDERLAMVVADISPAGAMEDFRREFPRRFVNTGVAEQIMIGMAAGMAMRGLRPFAYTIATFAMFRPFEFIRDDLCYQNLPVTVVGVGGGVTYSQLGGTHHAMEDVVLATALPGMTVLAPCDPYETAECTKWCARADGPKYLRLGKAGEPNLQGESWRVGKLRRVRDGEPAIIGYGPILKLAMDAVPEAAIYSCHTLKPLDRAGITNVLREHGQVLVLEEATRWLGDQVRVLDNTVTSLALRDDFPHMYGTHVDVLAAHGLTKEKIREAMLA